MNRAPGLRAAMREVLDATLAVTSFDGGGIYVVDSERRTASLRYHHLLPADFVDEAGTVSIDAPPYRALFLEEQPLYLTYYDRLQPERAARWGWRSVGSVPLLHAGRVVGALNLISRARRVFVPEERMLLEAVGRELGFAIVKAQAEGRLRVSEENLRNFFDGCRDMLLVLAEDGSVLHVNRAVERRLGYSRSECLSMTLADFHPQERQADVLRTYADMQNGEVEVCTVPVLAKDGALVPVEARVSRGVWDGQAASYATVRDVTSEKLLVAATTALSAVGGLREPYTASHERDVARLAELIASELGMSPEQTARVWFAASIHDVGKAAVPVEILTKPGPLTDAETGMMRVHPEVGYHILKPLEYLGPIPDIVRQHHERLDGSGYPDGLCGDEISLEARIIAAADTVEAMLSRRAFRTPHSIEDVIAEIRRLRGTALDADVVDVCLRLIEAGLLASVLDRGCENGHPLDDGHGLPQWAIGTGLQ